MYYLEKIIEISASHNLNLSYESKCKNIHGHNWTITIFCKSEKLNDNGMIVDFSEIKKIITDKLDHKNLNDEFKFNPTAENLSKWIVDTIQYCYKVTVQESKGNIVSYEN